MLFHLLDKGPQAPRSNYIADDSEICHNIKPLELFYQEILATPTLDLDHGYVIKCT